MVNLRELLTVFDESKYLGDKRADQNNLMNYNTKVFAENKSIQ